MLMKGKKIEKMVVVPVSATQRWREYAKYTAGALVLVVGAYFYGVSAAQGNQAQAADERDQLKVQVKVLSEDLSLIRSNVASYKVSSELGELAEETLRKDYKVMRTQISELEETVAFYKSIINPMKNDKGLRIEKLDIEPTKDKNQFKYALVLIQHADNSSFISGSVEVNIIGSKGDKKEILSLADVSSKNSTGKRKFYFQYYKKLSDRVTLPEGFTPEKVEIIARSLGRKAMRIERTFNWSV